MYKKHRIRFCGDEVVLFVNKNNQENYNKTSKFHTFVQFMLADYVVKLEDGQVLRDVLEDQEKAKDLFLTVFNG